ncbi:MAG: hypothetical protein LBO80_12130 [Treponema sp.]|jgi:predicted lipase|nr:hypothetical protein [Treponema sp.]
MLFAVNEDHFNEITNGPWESVRQTGYRLVIEHGGKVIHVTGQGSQSKDRGVDWRDDFDFRVRQPAEQWFADTKDIRVHAGFLRQYKQVRGTLMDAACQNPDYAVFVDGYSLGASWTQLFVQDVLYHFPKRVIRAILYEPGNPWRRLPWKYKAMLKKHITFVRAVWDPVTWMAALGFFRYGRHITIGQWWRPWPCQHLEDQVLRNLEERFG